MYVCKQEPTHYPLPITTLMECFSVCKIEAGRAVLLSQEDFELIEFPAKLLPKDYGKVKILVNSADDDEAAENEKEESLKMLLKEVEVEFGVGEREIERIKEEIGMEGFLRIESLGSTATILCWQRPFSEIFDKSIKVDSVILSIESGKEPETGLYDEFVDFVIKGQKGINWTDTRCRINLPIDLKVALVVKSSVGCFKSNTIKLKTRKFDDFSGIFLLTDVTDQPSTDRLEFIRDQGGYISRSYYPDQPITAVITDSFESDLFKVGIENNLPVVGSTWLEALVAAREVPHFEDHLLKRLT